MLAPAEPFSADASPAHRRFNDLMWYATNDIALTDPELAEVQQLADQLGIHLVWRHLKLGKFTEIEWREGRYHGHTDTHIPA